MISLQSPRVLPPLLRRIPRSIDRRSFSNSRQLRADQVRIIEVGPRDGLQNEKTSISLATKIELVNRLAATGLQTIEAGSFVHPKWVPQMANSSEILEHILQTPPPSTKPITYQWLLPNMKGLDNYFKVTDSSSAASAYPTPPPSPSRDSDPAFITSPTPNALPSNTPTQEISIFLAATESFSQKNTNCSIADSLTRFAPLMSAAKSRSTPVRAYISVALGCPYEGPDVDPGKVAELAATLLAMGASEISVADTTGMGTAPRTTSLLSALSAAGVPTERLALHFHDTYGQALVNTLVGLGRGVRAFDGAVAGLGGCPYSPGATGNVGSEDLVRFVEGMGMETGVDLVRLAEVGEWISGVLGKGNESRAGKALLARARAER